MEKNEIRQRIRQCVAIALLLLVVSDGRASGPSTRKVVPSTALNVSMVGLLAVPERFDKKLIRTEGFLCITSQDEGDALYLHEEDLRFALDNNAVSLSFSEEQRTRYKRASMKHVLIEGVFHANRAGPFQAGSIGEIQRLEIWEPSSTSGVPQSNTPISCPVAINPVRL